jgi:hypothetical protein
MKKYGMFTLFLFLMLSTQAQDYVYDFPVNPNTNDCPYDYSVLNYYIKNCNVNFTNKTVTTNTTVTSCGDINVQNVTVTNGAKLTLDAAGEVNIISDFEVELGSEFEIIE